jgi:SagB-type dehydrogenase family enzyme
LEPQLTSDRSLNNILGFRQSTPFQLMNQSFALQNLSQIIWAAQGVTHPPGRTVPSAGGTYPLDLFISTKIDMQYLPAGSYIYLSGSHEVKVNSVDDDYENQLQSGINDENDQIDIQNAPVVIIVTAEYERTTLKYGQRGNRYVHLEIGHLIQNLRIQAKALNIYTRIIFDFEEDILKSALNTEFIPQIIILCWETNSATASSQHKTKSSLNLSIIDEISVEEAIYQRKSSRDYLDHPPNRFELTHLIEYSVNRHDPWQNELVFPSLTGTIPVNVYISVSDVEDLASGLYYFDAENIEFRKINDSSRRLDVWNNSLNQAWVLNAPMSLVVTYNASKLSKSSLPSDLREKVAQMEVGSIAQNLYLLSYTLGLGMVVIGAFNDNGIREIINSDENEAPMYVIPVGKVESDFSDLVNVINISWFSSFAGWLALFFFYISCLIMTPPIRQKMPNKRWIIHLLLGIFSALFSLIHLILGHGGLSLIFTPSSERWREFFISSILTFTPGSTPDLYQYSLILIRLTFWIVLGFGIFAVKHYIKPFQGKALRWLYIFHKFGGYGIMITIFVHGLINGSWLNFYKPGLAILIGFLTISYVISRYWFNLVELFNNRRIKGTK